MISVIMPRQGQSVESCVITKWFKQVGDAVTPGELLFSYETDKAAFDEEAKHGGVMLAIIRQEGDDVPCLDSVCVIGEIGEDAGLIGSNDPAKEAEPVEPSFGKTPLNAIASNESPVDLPLSTLCPTSSHSAPAELSKISPRARALAQKSGANLSFVTATGPNGRVIERDIQALIDAGKMITKAAQGVSSETVSGTGLGGRVTVRDLAPAPVRDAAVSDTVSVPLANSISSISTAELQKTKIDSQGKEGAVLTCEAATVLKNTAIQESVASPSNIATLQNASTPEGFSPSYRDEPLSNIRKRISSTMFTSVSTMAQLTHSVTYDATNIVALRKQYKEHGKSFGVDGVTLGDLIIYGVVRTLTQPEHAPLNAHFLGDSIRYFANVHLGVAVDTPRGLMVPTVRNANQKTLLELSNEIKALSAACRTGAIDPDLLSGASFTVSNLGAYEIEHFTPIINPPQTGVLGINTIQQRVRERDGLLEMYPAMSLSLTYDHRALDGAPASAFLRDVKRNLENIPMLLGGGAYGV